MHRVSYRKNEEGNLVSNLMLLGSDMIYAIIYPATTSYEIRGLNDDTVWLIEEGTTLDLKECKVQVRKRLEYIGIKFNDEIRTKGK